MRHEHTTYSCDICEKESDSEMFLRGVEIETADTCFGEYDFCSFECFLKKLNSIMKDEHLNIEVRGVCQR